MRFWRVAVAAALFFLLPLGARAADTWSTWHTAKISNEGGTPVFLVNGKPFFVYGAAFFYERTPRSQWRDALLSYKRAGINTIDLYLIWNWHEPDSKTKDFTGATNSRRDLHALFSLVHELGFKTIVRPGPVIRNEWRNGGYPDWLLERPEYNMPLHDVLEGRYPATATYQNAHADAAAAEWLANRTHLAASSHWLHDVLHEVEPWSHDVLAIALDDDQGAYIDNDTWPAPHWHQYMSWLRSTVQSTVGTNVPLFINTFQMKVTASAPAWAWGNWYQSDAEIIGDHDIAQLGFSTALLQTQPGKPVMASEFQAGWLQGADEVAARASTPQNTTIALHEMLQYGAHGVVNFPLADTLNPAGWEAPWTNWFYAWRAAFSLQGTESPRASAVDAFGSLLRTHGADLATMRPQTDIEIAWLPSAYDATLVPNDRIGHMADLTIAALQRCRTLARTCRLVDLRYDSLNDLRATRFLVVPQTGFPMRYLPSIDRRLAGVRAAHVAVEASVDAAVAAGASSATHGITDAALLVNPHGTAAVFDAFNASQSARAVPSVTVRLGNHAIKLPAYIMAPQSACDFWIDRNGAHDITVQPLAPAAPPSLPPSRVPVTHAAWTATASTPDDAYDDGSPTLELNDGAVRVVIAANAGARVFLFENLADGKNLFTSIGAVRDDVESPPPPSPRDYIAAYTHPIEAGTFNRPYQCAYGQERKSVTCTYEAPDFGPAPVHFTKHFELDGESLVVTIRASEPAASLSAIAPAGVDVAWPKDPQAQAQETVKAEYRLERLVYPANRDETIRFTLSQGAPPTAANRP